ncbi:MAG: hypothetical protein JWL73_1419 [Actinomycetia bacterium]|nr:hypothetical protein [Actinomycetes bacterium]
MVPGLAFLATAVATLFAQATLARYTAGRKPHELAWTVALAMFAVASAALALGASTGWDNGTFRVFYLFGAVLNVPWLALGTVYLLFGLTVGRRVQWFLVFVSGLAAGVLFTAPIDGPLKGNTIPVGSDVFGVFPRVLAATGSGVAAIVIFAGAIYSAVRFARRRSQPGAARMAAANGLIALGTLVLSSGGLVQGVVGHDEAFTLSVAVGISVVYAGFLVASTRPAGSPARATPPDPALSDLAT